MTAALLPPLAALLLGYGVLRLAGVPWPRPALLAAGLLAGAPLATLLLYSMLAAGLPYGAPLAGGVLAAGALVCAAGSRRPRPPLLAAARWLVPALAALLAALLQVLRLLARPAPQGDGLANFAMKARFFHEERTLWTFLGDARLAPLHLDYPLHVPLGMDLGFLLAGKDDALFGLALDAFVLPAAVLLAGVIAARRSALAGAVAALLLAGLPAAHAWSEAGYADLPLMGLVAVAGVALADGPPARRAAALAIGLMPWVKLEGLVLAAVLGGALFVGLRRERAQPWGTLLAALALGATWPLTLIVTGLARPLAEKVAEASAGERAAAIAEGFARPLADPAGPLGFCLAAGALAAVQALWARRQTALAGAFLALLAVLPALAWLRRTALMHLDAAVPVRLYLQIAPLAIHLAALELAHALAGRAAGAPRDADADGTGPAPGAPRTPAIDRPDEGREREPV